VDENDTQRRHAGAHYADVDLNGGPIADIDLVPGGVCRVGEVNKGLETNDGYNRDTAV
jgi:hypothetical protein